MPEERGIGPSPSSDNTPSNRGKNWLLVIGIDEYKHHRPLSNAVADAEAFVSVMTTRYGFELLTPKPLLNSDATQKNIKKALGKCESLEDDDRLIVFYSGHGWYKKAAKLGYLVPCDAEDDPNSDFIEVTSILNIFKSVNARHILLVVDCCFGGSFGINRNVKVAQTQAMTEKKISKLDTLKSRMFLSSGDIEPVSDGLIAGDNSPFTKPLVKILTEIKASQMAFSEFFNLLQKETFWNADQIPQYKVLQHLGHEDGELALYCTDLESEEEQAYRELMEKQSIALMEKFIRAFRDSPRKTEVRELLKAKRAEEKWAKIKNSRHIEVFDEFIDDFPDSPLTQLAKQKIDELEFINEAEENAQKEKDRLAVIERKKREEEEQLWHLCESKRTPSVYLDKYPNGRFAVQAFNMKTAIEEAEKQKKIAEENAQKEKGRLVAIERKKQEEAERIRLLYEPEMVLVEGGSFKMGSNEYDNEKPIHDVTVKDFYIGKYPITQKQWQNIMGDNPSRFKGETLPVEQVSWEDCQVFIKKLNDKTGKKYRLPTEAEWEYAARGGTKRNGNGFKYAGSNDLKEVAWYSENSDSKTHPVGTKKANELGIHDMTGNVWEWCNDWYKGYPGNSGVSDYTGSYRVFRGGGWSYGAGLCRVAFRNYSTPPYRSYYLGFRLAISPPQ